MKWVEDLFQKKIKLTQRNYTSYIVQGNMQQIYLHGKFNKTYHEAIEVFQGEYIICAPIHMIDLQTKGNANYVALILKMTHNL